MEAEPFIAIIDAYVGAQRGLDRADPTAQLVTPGMRRADALMAMVQQHSERELAPNRAGDRPRVVVTLNYHAMRRPCTAGWHPPASQSLRGFCADCFVTPRSSRSFSAIAPRCSMLVARDGSSRLRSGLHSSTATRVACFLGATSRQPPATPTICSPGGQGARRHSRIWFCCARTTTASSSRGTTPEPTGGPCSYRTTWPASPRRRASTQAEDRESTHASRTQSGARRGREICRRRPVAVGRRSGRSVGRSVAAPHAGSWDQWVPLSPRRRPHSERDSATPATRSPCVAAPRT